jgi:hypothetical protein
MTIIDCPKNWRLPPDWAIVSMLTVGLGLWHDASGAAGSTQSKQGRLDAQYSDL